jgi:hypothetical protein
MRVFIVLLVHIAEKSHVPVIGDRWRGKVLYVKSNMNIVRAEGRVLVNETFHV